MILEVNLPILIFSYLHFFAYTILCFSPLIIPSEYEYYNYLFICAVIIQWLTLDGCILTNKDVFESDFVRVLYFSGLFSDLNYIDVLEYISNLVILPAFIYYSIKFRYLLVGLILSLFLVHRIKIK